MVLLFCGLFLLSSFAGLATGQKTVTGASRDAAKSDDGAAEKTTTTAKETTTTSEPAGTASADDDIWWKMISQGHECSSDDVDIGEAQSVEECAMRCAVFEGCQYFIFGTGDKKNNCWYEATTDGCRADGHLVENSYNLYMIHQKDMNNEEFETVDGLYKYYRMVVTSARVSDPNASFCIEDIVFYDASLTAIDTDAPECSLEDVQASMLEGSDETKACCMSTASLDGHSCVEAFDSTHEDGWFCSDGTAGFLGFQFSEPTYVFSYKVHDVYGVRQVDPEAWTLQGSVNGSSWTVLDTALNVPWISEEGKYYNVLGGVSYYMVFREAECSSPDIMLGMVQSVDKCAEACANIETCQWFIYGKNEKAGRCYYEITEDGCESDGYPERNDYDLYYVQRAGDEGDGGETVGEVVHSKDPTASSCGSFFGSCSNVFLLLFLLLTLVGGIWIVRSILRKRYSRISQSAVEYDSGHDQSEA